MAIVQARMGSSRLPGKSLAMVVGRPLILHVLDRTQGCALVERIVVATTGEREDDPLAAAVEDAGYCCFRGSRDDVLDRYYQAARLTGAGIIVRITADDPFKDPRIIDRMIGELLADPSLDYVSNTLEPTFPEGIDAEVFTFQALETAWRNASLGSEREHVTPWIWKNRQRFKVKNIRHSDDLSHLRWTVDYPEDLRFCRAVYAELYRPGELFFMEEILSLLARRPELQSINQGIVRNAGYLASLRQDRTTPGPDKGHTTS